MTSGALFLLSGLATGFLGAFGSDLWQSVRKLSESMSVNPFLLIAVPLVIVGVILLVWDRLDKLELTEAEALLIKSVKIEATDAKDFHITSSAFTTSDGIPAVRSGGTFVVDQIMYELHGVVDVKTKEILSREWKKKPFP